MQTGFSSLQIIAGALIVVVLLFGAYYFGNSSYIQPSPTTQQVHPIDETSVYPTFDPVTKIAYTQDGDIFVYDLKNGDNKKLTDHKYNSDPVISPDGTKVAYLSTPQTIIDTNQLKTNFANVYKYKNIWIINSDGTNPIQITNDLKKRSGISWHKTVNGSLEIIFEQDGKLIKYDLKNNDFSSLSDGSSPIFAHNSSYFAYLTNEGKTLNMQPDGLLKSFQHDKKISDLNWSYDNKHIFFTSIDTSDQQGHTSTLRLKYAIWYYSPYTQNATQITEYQDLINLPTISPDGRYLVAKQGHGYFDAGMSGLRLVVLPLKEDLTVEKEIYLKEFQGPEDFNKNKDQGSDFPETLPIWISNDEFVVLYR